MRKTNDILAKVTIKNQPLLYKVIEFYSLWKYWRAAEIRGEIHFISLSINRFMYDVIDFKLLNFGLRISLSQLRFNVSLRKKYDKERRLLPKCTGTKSLR